MQKIESNNGPKNKIIEHIKNAVDLPNTPSGTCVSKYKVDYREFSSEPPVMSQNEKGFDVPNPPEGCVCKPGMEYAKAGVDTDGKPLFACRDIIKG